MSSTSFINAMESDVEIRLSISDEFSNFENAGLSWGTTAKGTLVTGWAGRSDGLVADGVEMSGVFVMGAPVVEIIGVDTVP